MANLRDFLNKNALKSNGVTPPETKPEPALVAAVKPAEPPSGLRQAVNRFARPGNKPSTGEPAIAKQVEKPGLVVTKPPEVVADITKATPAAIVAPRDVPKAELIVGDLAATTVDDLRTALTYLAEHIEHKELVGQVVRRIAQMLIVNPQFSTQMPMERKDFNLLVRGLRRSYNVAARKKTEKGEEKAKKGLEKALDIAELENLLNSF